MRDLTIERHKSVVNVIRDWLSVLMNTERTTCVVTHCKNEAGSQVVVVNMRGHLTVGIALHGVEMISWEVFDVFAESVENCRSKLLELRTSLRRE